MNPGVIVFVMDGCPACEQYLPRLHDKAREHGIKLNVYNVEDRRGSAIADDHRVRATPTTIGRNSRGALKRKVGAMENADLDKFLSGLLS